MQLCSLIFNLMVKPISEMPAPCRRALAHRDGFVRGGRICSDQSAFISTLILSLPVPPRPTDGSVRGGHSFHLSTRCAAEPQWPEKKKKIQSWFGLGFDQGRKERTDLDPSFVLSSWELLSEDS